MTFGQNSDKPISTKSTIKLASVAPNFYPQALYQTALVSTDNDPDLTHTIDVDPNKNYSVWLHLAEIDPSVTDVGQRVIDISINGNIVFRDIDIVRIAGGVNSALVLNTTIPVSGRILTITLHPTTGTHAIINAIEIFEVIPVESKTLPEEGKLDFSPVLPGCYMFFHLIHFTHSKGARFSMLFFPWSSLCLSN